MDTFATHKHARMSPQKIRPVGRLLRGMNVQLAGQQLQFMPGKAPKLLAAVLKSAVANAVHNHDLKQEDLVVRQVKIDAGLVMKRIMPVSRGMAHGILKRTSHITVVVGEAVPGTAKPKKAKKAKIEEVSLEEFAARKREEALEHTHEEEEGELNKKAPVGERTVEDRQDKQGYEAMQRNKMIQQGGDKKKSHRRKSIGGK